MTFHSLLFRDSPPENLVREAPPCLHDLNLDLVIDAITEPQERHHLRSYFYTPLQDVRDILYRQEVMKELENPSLMEAIKDFMEGMATVKRYLALGERLDFEYHKKGWFLEGALLYCQVLTRLGRNLAEMELKSRGFRAFREYLGRVTASPSFQSLVREAQEVKEALSRVRYCIILQDGKFKVKRYEGEGDYSREVERTFEKFRQREGEEDRLTLPKGMGTSHIEAKILEFVSRLYPEPFGALDRFGENHAGFLDDTILRFEREIQFYIAYLEFMAPLRARGLPFSYPRVNPEEKEEAVREGFDIALAHSQERAMIPNDYYLKGPERIIVVTGPNQGGKTTFARMLGQIHYLASLGLPVPAREARLFLPDKIFTHFEKEETIHDLHGKLEDDLLRIHQMLSEASSRSLFVVNEIFSSTAFQDAAFLSREIMKKILDLDAMGVWVTFVDELSSMNEKVVSMVATVSPHDPAIRTFKIIRAPARGLAYALSLVRKHRLTPQEIRERIR